MFQAEPDPRVVCFKSPNAANTPPGNKGKLPPGLGLESPSLRSAPPKMGTIRNDKSPQQILQPIHKLLVCKQTL